MGGFYHLSAVQKRMVEVNTNRLQIDITIDYATTDAFVYEWLSEREIAFKRWDKTSGSVFYQIIWDEEIYGPGSTDSFTILKRLENTRFIFYHPVIEYWEANLIVDITLEFGAQFTDPDNPIVLEIKRRRGRPKERSYEQQLQLAREYLATQAKTTQIDFCANKMISPSTLREILSNPAVREALKSKFRVTYK